MRNRYFIISVNNSKRGDIIKCCVQTSTSTRKSLDKTLELVKLPKGDKENHDCLTGIKEYDYENILIKMATLDWSKEDEFV